MTNDKDERDFWTLSAYVPKRDASERAKMARRESAGRDTSSVEIELSGSGDDKRSDAPRHATALSYSHLAQRFREVDLTQTPPMPQVPPIPPVPPVPPVSPVPSVTQVPPVPPATQMPQVQNPRSVPVSTSRPASKPVSIPRVQTAKKKESGPIYEIDIKNDFFIEEYVPKDCYIMKVAIYGCTEYDFYAGFRRDAKKYFKATVKKAENVPFVSYTPQYSTMKREQLAYYFWWRDNVRHSVYPDADYSYISLYLSEIINLPDLMPPEEGLDAMCRVWLAYRRKYKTLDKYLSEWVLDYCLIHKLPCPTEKLAPIMDKMVKNTKRSHLIGFYISSKPDGIGADMLINIFSDYSWKESTCLTKGIYSQKKDELKKATELFSRHVSGSVSYASKKTEQLSIKKEDIKVAHLMKHVFCGALVSTEVRRRLRIEYASFTHSSELRTTVTLAVKYAENKIRAYLGIKSRLQVNGLAKEITDAMDEYFSLYLPSDAYDKSLKEKARDREIEEEKLYDAIYEPESDVLDMESAKDIEMRSWQITEKLTEALENNEDEKTETAESVETAEKESPTVTPEPAFAPAYTDGDTIRSALDEALIGFLDTALSGSAEEQAEYCRRRGIYADSAAAKINETAVDIIGDIILERSNDGKAYKVIDDYREEASQ